MIASDHNRGPHIKVRSRPLPSQPSFPRALLPTIRLPDHPTTPQPAPPPHPLSTPPQHGYELLTSLGQLVTLWLRSGYERLAYCKRHKKKLSDVENNRYISFHIEGDTNMLYAHMDEKMATARIDAMIEEVKAYRQAKEVSQGPNARPQKLRTFFANLKLEKKTAVAASSAS